MGDVGRDLWNWGRTWNMMRGMGCSKWALGCGCGTLGVRHGSIERGFGCETWDMGHGMSFV